MSQPTEGASDLANYAGPFRNLQDAMDHIHAVSGEGPALVRGTARGYYANDGIDSETGEYFKNIPADAKWYTITKSVSYVEGFRIEK